MRLSIAIPLLSICLAGCEGGPDTLIGKREWKVVLNGQTIYVHPDNPIDIPDGNKTRFEGSTITITGPDPKNATDPRAPATDITIRGKRVDVRGNTIMIDASQFDASTFKKVRIDRNGNIHTDTRTESR